MIDLKVKDPNEALQLVMELKETGLLANRDFQWEFIPAPNDWLGYSRQHRVTFIFQDSSLETFFQLKWSQYGR